MTRQGTPKRAQWGSWDWRLCAWWVGVSVVVSIGLVPIWKWLYATLSRAHYLVSAELVPFLLMGLVIGLGQWLALHHRLRLGKIGWWLAGGIVDGFAFLGVFLVRAADNSSGPDVYLVLGMLGGVAGAVAGLVQWGALRGTVWWARWWIAVSIAGYAVGWPSGVFVGVVVGSAFVRSQSF